MNCARPCRLKGDARSSAKMPESTRRGPGGTRFQSLGYPLGFSRAGIICQVVPAKISGFPYVFGGPGWNGEVDTAQRLLSVSRPPETMSPKLARFSGLRAR